VCVSVGELRDAIGLFGPREWRAMSRCDGFVVIPLVLYCYSLPPIVNDYVPDGLNVLIMAL